MRQTPAGEEVGNIRHLCSTRQNGGHRLDSCSLVHFCVVMLHGLVHHFESAVKLLGVAPPSITHVDSAQPKCTRREDIHNQQELQRQWAQPHHRHTITGSPKIIPPKYTSRISCHLDSSMKNSGRPIDPVIACRPSCVHHCSHPTTVLSDTQSVLYSTEQAEHGLPGCHISRSFLVCPDR